MTLPRKFRFIVCLLLSLFLLSLFTKTIYAQDSSWAFISPEEFAGAIDATRPTQETTDGTTTTVPGTVNMEGYIGIASPLVTMYGWSCFLAGEPCTQDEAEKEVYFQNSLIYKSSGLIATIYTNPVANTGTWIADVGQNIGIVRPAYAQGIGFSALNPILGIWKIMRNVAYALLIVLLLVIGLMIMFRSKIDPRTVISVQSALPRIVMTLILITFSYPIAGLMIDLMYLTLFLGVSVLGPIIPEAQEATVSQLQAQFAAGGGLGRMFASLSPEFVGTGLLSTALTAIPVIPALLGGRILAGITGTLSKLLTGQVTGSTVLFGATGTGALIFLLVVFAIIFAIIRIFFLLLNAYIQIIIAVIFAPILLLGQAVPGQSAFSNWIRGLAGNLSVFPTTAILILVADIVSDAFYRGGTLFTPLWTPPIIGDFGSSMGAIMIPLGFALVIPQIVQTVKKAIGAKPIVPVGGAVARAIGQPIGIVQQTIGTLGQIRLLQSGRH